MRLVSEKKDVQDLIKDHLCSIGWDYLDASDIMNLRANSLKEPLLIPIIKEKLKELNQGIITDKNIQDIIRNLRLLPANLHGNEEFLKYLRNQKTIYVEKEKRERNIKLVDYENPENNSFICTTEFVFEDKQKRRADIILFVNGFPIAIIETKSPTVEEAEEEAYDQIRLYNELLPELFKFLQFYTTGDGIRLYHGPTWKYEPKLFYRWKTQNHYNFEKLTKTLLNKQETLRTLQDYVTFQRIDEELHKYILVPHQRRTIDKIIQKILENKEKGLIWHTQGAYKTLTMITTAKKLRENPQLENPTIIVVVDRIELEAQIHQNFEAFGFPKEIIQKAESKEHLRELLASDYRGLIITIIHKFEGMPKHINKRSNIIVLIDEAHRSQEGDLGNYMRGALPNARYFGFTGTPVDKGKIGRGTFATFGYPEEPYLDKYSIDESIEDKTTVPLYYQLTPTKLHVDKETLEKEFFKVIEEQGVASIEGVNRIIEKAKKTKAILKSPDRVDKIAQHIAEHYKKFVEPLGFKAFIVAVDREGCALYKEAIDKYLPKEYTKVIYTSNYKDGALLSKYHINEDEEKKTRKAFKKPKEMPKILIVTEKLLTGYDAPILYAMYLDKPLKDHTLYQAIARVNRPYEAKTCGIIIDFIGLFENLQRALAFDSKDISKGLIDINTLKERFTTLITQAKTTIENIQIKDQKDRVTKIIDYFYDEKTRDQYIKTFKETQALYEILSPDEFLRDHIRDYKLLIQVYKIIYNAYNPEAEQKKIYRDILKKTEALIKSSVDLKGITDTLPPYKITKQITRLIKADKAPERVKVINLHRTLTTYIHQNKQKQPILISISEKVEEIIKQLREKQKDIATALTELTKLAEAIAASKEEQEKSGLTKEEFTTYWILRNYKVNKPETMAKNIFPELERHKEWLYNEKTERDLRRELYKLLLPTAPKETLVELTDNLLKMHKFLTEGTE
ncbi:MAG TPA: HsdR family type I site-specific deoxyribonuclease [Candidatus Bathyarchaeia archaeon]|nr:HsdR family type I site-specific deoxyribonuclease [Candidatus Bathyarchaeia archaeon]